MVGLPALGKSTISRQLGDFLSRHSYRYQIYNAGEIRRQNLCCSTSDFFDPANEEASQQREEYANVAIERMLCDFDAGLINVGFLDATNTTQSRRGRMMRILRSAGIAFENVVILNVSLLDDSLEDYNIRAKASNKDYRGQDPQELVADFRRRTMHYLKVYESVTREELQGYDMTAFCSIHNGREKDIVCDADNEVWGLIRSFVGNYYKLHGQHYLAGVRREFGAHV